MAMDSVIPSGSPLLLHIWLQERFSIVAPPTSSDTYRPDRYHLRRLLIRFSTAAEWFDWIRQCHFTIRWDFAWYNFGKISLPDLSLGVVPLIGMRTTSFCSIYRLFCQFGLKQEIPPDRASFPVVPLTLPLWVDVHRYWASDHRPFARHSFANDETPFLSSQYQGWLMDLVDLKVGPSRLLLDDTIRMTSTERVAAGIPEEGAWKMKMLPSDPIDDTMAAIQEGFRGSEGRKRARLG